MNKIYICLAILGALLISCSNSDNEFPDFDYQTVYFANQYYVRTIELGEDLYVDTSIDNEQKMKIKATLGGTRNNKKNRTINFQVDESLCRNLYFEGGMPFRLCPLPTISWLRTR